MPETKWDGSSALASALMPLEHLLSGFSHQIGNDVAFLLGTMEMAALGMGSGPTVDSLGELHSNFFSFYQRLQQTSRSLRAPRPEHLEWCSLALCLARAEEMARCSLENAERVPQPLLQTNVPMSMRLRGYDSLLTSALAGIVLNAWEADAEEVDVSARAVEDGIEVVVSDTGSGICEDGLPHVAEPFVTTKSSPHWGLGLTVALLAGVHHNGSLTVASEGPGKGARVALVLRSPLQAQ